MDSVKIKYVGHACFKLTYEGQSIILDPYRDAMVPGLADMREEANFVYCSHQHDDHNYQTAVSVTGEATPNYDLEEIVVPHDDAGGTERGMNTIRVLTFGSLRIAHLGDIGRELTDDEAEKLRNLDCLMIPVGGFFTIDAQTAKKIAAKIQPKVIIPMHYRSECFGFEMLSPVTDFTDGMDNVTFGGCEMILTEDTASQVRALWPANAPARIMDKAIGYHTAGYNCAQSVLCACGEFTGLDEKTALSVSCGFGGGLRYGEVCGAISGAVMALGLVFPYNDSTDTESKDRAARLARECVERCRTECGNVTCRDLKGQCGKSCDELIAICARITEKMIIENK